MHEEDVVVSLTDTLKLAEELKKIMKNKNLSKNHISNISSDIFSSSRLGWINCDRFLNDNKPKIDYFVKIEDPVNTDIKIVFNDIKSISYGEEEDNEYIFRNIPIGQNITIVALKYQNKQYFLALKETKIQANGAPELTFQPVTIQNLKETLEKSIK